MRERYLTWPEILAVVEAGGVPDADNLDSLRNLCADLPGTMGSGQLLAWANASVPADVPDVVFGVLSDAGLLASGDPMAGNPGLSSRRQQVVVSVPADADDLWSRLWEVDEQTAVDLLLNLEVSSARDRSRRARRLRRYQDEPGEVFEELVRLTGPGTHWWTNTDFTSWNPITQHAFDAIVVGAGNGIVVTLIAFDGN